LSITQTECESLLQSVCESTASMVTVPFFSPFTVAEGPAPATVATAGFWLFQTIERLLGVIVARAALLSPTQTAVGPFVIVTFTASPLQVPLLHLSLTVHMFLSV